ncbi:hypothetical protein [Nocardioides sp. Soil796]|uniref:hypothetical protein n=1 Tax=Nocardioides sp. Soil796 TaxID=1736412 RepID=UPI0012E36696|nr:hypothetical protein [Nocardioides sp. Soil796]
MSEEDVARVWRLEFAQPPGGRIAWLGPYTSQWLTPAAEELARYMEAEHRVTRPHPKDPAIFDSYRGDDRLACGCASREHLESWFGDYLPLLMDQGGHVAEYAVGRDAIVEDSPEQVLFIKRRGRLVQRTGHEPPSQLIRSSAGSRTALLEAGDRKYAYVPGRSSADLRELTTPASVGPVQ